MKHSDYKKLILKRIDWINQMLGTKYQTNYAKHYGGWNLYIVDETSFAHYRGRLGFDFRIESKEMLCYLEGVCNGLTCK